MFNAWWGIMPPFGGEWFDIGDSPDTITIGDFPNKTSNVLSPKEITLHVDLPDFLSQMEKLKEQVGKLEADNEDEYERGWNDCFEQTKEDLESEVEFLRFVWNAEGKAFDALKKFYLERNPSEAEDEVCTEDIMEDIINGELPVSEMMYEYDYPAVATPQVNESAIKPMDIIRTMDGTRVVVVSIDGEDYRGFDLETGNKVGGKIRYAEKIGRLEEIKEDKE